MNEQEAGLYLATFDRILPKFQQVTERYQSADYAAACGYAATGHGKEYEQARAIEYANSANAEKALVQFILEELYPFLSHFCTRERKKSRVRMALEPFFYGPNKKMLWGKLTEVFDFHYIKRYRSLLWGDEEIVFLGHQRTYLPPEIGQEYSKRRLGLAYVDL